MKAIEDTSRTALIKSIFISFLWAAGSAGLSFYFEWPAAQLAKAFYILIAYSLIFLFIECFVWRIADYFRPKDETEMFRARFFGEDIEFLIYPAFGAYLFFVNFPKILFSRIDDLETLAETNAFGNFLKLSLENWWLVIIVGMASTFKILHRTRVAQSDSQLFQEFLERAHVTVFTAVTGFLILTVCIASLFTGHEQTTLYIILIVLFFAPWEPISLGFIKVYETYWKV